MQIGCLGELIFSVSDSLVQTLSNMQWSGGARYATHQRHLKDALAEFCGLDPDKISFDLVLSAFLGVEPQAELNKIWQYERSGEAVSLVIGDKINTAGIWLVTRLKCSILTKGAICCKLQFP